MKQVNRIASGLVLTVLLLMAGASHAQVTTIGFWKKETTLMNTYLLTGEMVSVESLKSSLFWDASKLVLEHNQKTEDIIRDPANLFVIPVTEEVEKGVRNYQFVLARGKAGTYLPKSKDESGFYLGGSGLEVIASVYVDPKKMGTRFAGLYISSLNGLLMAGASHSSQEGFASFLKENYWYEGMSSVHFEAAQLMPPLNDTTTLQSLMPHARVHSHAEYLNDLGGPNREDCFADVLEIYQKGGKSSYQAFFFSFTDGLVYCERLSSEDRKSAIFTKKDIYKYGIAQILGKK